MKAAAAPVAKTMQAFGSGPAPAEEGMAGLDSLLSGFGSLSGLAGAAAQRASATSLTLTLILTLTQPQPQPQP